jgi:predicted neuraminidase
MLRKVFSISVHGIEIKNKTILHSRSVDDKVQLEVIEMKGRQVIYIHRQVHLNLLFLSTKQVWVAQIYKITESVGGKKKAQTFVSASMHAWLKHLVIMKTLKSQEFLSCLFTVYSASGRP